MSLGTALDVAIGVILVYLLLGLLASACQEVFAGIVKLRGRKLLATLDVLLESGRGELADLVKTHSLVRMRGGDDKPSYVPAKNFALALFDSLANGRQAPLFSQIESGVASLADGPAKTALTVFVRHAGGDLDALRGHVERWFDDAMDRLSGDYKRWSRYFLLAFGFAVAVGLNVDSIRIASTLWSDPAARAALVEAAQRVDSARVKPSSGNADANEIGSDEAQAAARDALVQLRALPVPIGWYRDFFADPLPQRIWHVLGWLLTAFGVAMGAPFWFDLLQRALSLRAAGPKPPRADGERAR